MPYQDFRQFLDVLRQQGELVDVDRPIALTDVGKALKQAYQKGRPAVCFNDNGTEFPLVCGVYSDRNKALLAFQSDEKSILQKVLDGLDNPIAPTMANGGAPCHEVVITGDDIDINRFPIPTYSPKDGGPYITPGIVVSKDPETGVPDIGHYRFLILGKDTFSFSAQPFHRFGKNLAKCQKMGVTPKAALIIGVDPILAYTCQVQVHDQTNDWEIAGGLRGEPIELRQMQDLRHRSAGHRRGGDRVRGRHGQDRDGGPARRIHRLLHAGLAEAGRARHRDHASQEADLPGPAHRQAGDREPHPQADPVRGVVPQDAQARSSRPSRACRCARRPACRSMW